MDNKQAKELVRTFIQVPMASGTRQEELDFYKDINDAFVMLINALEENEKLDKIKEIIDTTETTVDENNYDSKNTTEITNAYLEIVKIVRGEENGNQ